jgi:hypothetical protein
VRFLDPFHRAAGDFCASDISTTWGIPKVYAKTAARIQRDARGFGPVTRSARHHRMHAERALEVCQRIVAALGWLCSATTTQHSIGVNDRREIPSSWRCGDPRAKAASVSP